MIFTTKRIILLNMSIEILFIKDMELLNILYNFKIYIVTHKNKK